jgi:hypothetical protein
MWREIAVQSMVSQRHANSLHFYSLKTVKSSCALKVSLKIVDIHGQHENNLQFWTYSVSEKGYAAFFVNKSLLAPDVLHILPPQTSKIWVE